MQTQPLNWRQRDSWIRWVVLITALSGVATVTGRVLLYPAQSKVLSTAYRFPEQVALAGQPGQAEALALDPEFPEFYATAHRYRYQYQERSVDIEMYYLVRPNAELTELLEDQFNQVPNPETALIKQSPDTGAYLTYSDSDRVYLTACINPHGGSTVTDQAFKYNRNFHDIQHRLLPWLRGEPLKDERCLWAQLSTPAAADDAAATRTLEQAWKSWYDWWQAHFPEATTVN
ncbi:MAG: cyanoexosortase A system-associated protein [Leptolyngbya sp. SIO4C1]|nr:cyanoexosortase A system-associated protein [Leptolyngbya sp. SIO4C1]